MILYPKLYIEKVTHINVGYLKKNNIEGIILDVDNTLIDYNKNMIKGLSDWIQKIKANNIKCMILSNTNKQAKVKKVADFLDIPYIYMAKKPLRFGFIKAQKLLGIPNENIAVIGDQVFTDVLGANHVNMHSILVKQVDKKDLFFTSLKRPLERVVLKRYFRKSSKM